MFFQNLFCQVIVVRPTCVVPYVLCMPLRINNFGRRLKQAKYLEAFLNRVERRYQIALWQSRIIEAPTDSPVIAIKPPS